MIGGAGRLFRGGHMDRGLGGMHFRRQFESTTVRPRGRFLLLAERIAWVLGLVGLAVWGAFHIWIGSETREDLERFAARRALSQRADALAGRRSNAPVSAEPDQSLWSPQRTIAWQNALNDPAPAALAVLRIPKIHLEVPVLPGTDDRTLDRAVGHIEDTAPPGGQGNAGIAGHRDGFFRGLKDIVPGDEIEVETLEGKDVYRVERTWIVEPDDVSVLDPTPARALTLVTCYPFYFVGSAPQRFIVRAVSTGDPPALRSLLTNLLR
jgi:sortase A